MQRHFLDESLKMFRNGAPSRGWVEDFIRRRLELRKMSMRVLEDKQFNADTLAKVSEIIERVRRCSTAIASVTRAW